MQVFVRFNAPIKNINERKFCLPSEEAFSLLFCVEVGEFVIEGSEWESIVAGSDGGRIVDFLNLHFVLEI